MDRHIISNEVQNTFFITIVLPLLFLLLLLRPNHFHLSKSGIHHWSICRYIHITLPFHQSRAKVNRLSMNVTLVMIMTSLFAKTFTLWHNTKSSQPELYSKTFQLFNQCHMMRPLNKLEIGIIVAGSQCSHSI
jgi:hypothetical protein